MEKPNQTKLREMLPYEPDTYLSQDEVRLLQATFRGNEKLLKVLRKLMLPSAFDPELPIEEMMGDVWMVDKDFSQLPVGEIKAIVLARQDAIKFILGGLIKLKVIANSVAESPMEAAARRSMDSAQ